MTSKARCMLTRFLQIVLIAAPTQLMAGIAPEDFARAPDVLNVKISPKGDYLGVLRLVEDKRALAILTFPDLKLSGVMSFPGRNQVLDFDWVSDDRVIGSVTRDFGRWEQLRPSGELFGMDADGGRSKHLFGYRAGADDVPSYTKQTNRQYASGQVIHSLPDDAKNVLIQIRSWGVSAYQGSMPHDQRAVEAAKMNIYSGRLTRRVRAPTFDAAMMADKEGNIRFAFSTSDEFESVVHVRDLKSGEWSELSRTSYGDNPLNPISVDEDTGNVLVSHAIGDGAEGLFHLDLETRKLEPVYQNPVADALPVLDDDQNLWAVRVDPDYPKLITLDADHPHAKLLAQLEDAFPGRFASVVGASKGNAYVIIGLRDDNSTTEYYLFDRKARQVQLLFDAQPWIDDGLLGEMRPIQVTARDGLLLRGYLTMPPPTRKGDKVPLVVHPHGGPHGPRDYWGYNPYVQILATHGYAVLQLNYRGSGGYGPHFESLGFGKWPTTMQNDLTDAVRWAVSEGIADPERVCIYGWSYGGYASLMSVVKEPDLYACSVPAAGVYDMDIQYEKSDFAQFTVWGEKYINKVIGPTSQDRANASPLTYIDRLKTPLFIVHGDEDARVPVENAEVLKKALDERGIAHEYMVKKNEGHGFFKEENRVEFFRELLAFLDQHIGANSESAAGAGGH